MPLNSRAISHLPAASVLTSALFKSSPESPDASQPVTFPASSRIGFLNSSSAVSPKNSLASFGSDIFGISINNLLSESWFQTHLKR